MYILIIANGYPTPKYNGLGIFEFDQAKALAEQGCKVLYAAVDLRSIRRWRKWGFEQFQKDGVDVYAINIPLGRIPQSMLQAIGFWGLQYLYKMILKTVGKPDVLHAHFGNMGIIAAKLKTRVGIPLVITEHSSVINKEEIRNQRLLKTIQSSYSKSDCLIAVSPALARRIKNHFGFESKYIPNMVDEKVFYFFPGKATQIVNFVSVGNLIKGKRMDLTIEAFYRAFFESEEKKEVHLYIYGEGDERRTCETLIRKYDLKDHVHLMGRRSREEIADTLKNAQCFVLASRAETFGVAYIEALACGVPVIATRCGGPETFVHEKNGILIPVDDLSALVQAMRKMYKTGGLYNRESIAKETMELFSSEYVARKLIQTYQDICGGEAVIVKQGF